MKIKVVVHPNSKPPRIIKDLLQTLHIYVGEPALENRANKAVVEALAEFYKIPKSCVKLVAGEKSKSKVFELALIGSKTINNELVQLKYKVVK